MIVLFGAGASEAFSDLPQNVREDAAPIIDLLIRFPKMFPVRRRGLMKGFRYFVVRRFLFYYSLSSDEIRLTAILPAAFKQA